jgi:hypothetical protein
VGTVVVVGPPGLGTIPVKLVTQEVGSLNQNNRISKKRQREEKEGQERMILSSPFG